MTAILSNRCEPSTVNYVNVACIATIITALGWIIVLMAFISHHSCLLRVVFTGADNHIYFVIFLLLQGTHSGIGGLISLHAFFYMPESYNTLAFWWLLVCICLAGFFACAVFSLIVAQASNLAYNVTQYEKLHMHVIEYMSFPPMRFSNPFHLGFLENSLSMLTCYKDERPLWSPGLRIASLKRNLGIKDYYSPISPKYYV
ncbi:hypothetical protein Pelo_477 [Pelomyxa schiedti]|nr:hypothetical protein Pelo_477 [Pelomyxa schiedti]